ncbi:hypothetical protein BDV59DRAFT_106349 [Aspergillus ambiguus]|uniref:uncharacterized protein n=1 Tax=Aspergillus ambiguus TaxID=176160 RepID=UPI003CCDEF29
MPRWGRPPGARLGRQTGRRMAPWMEAGDARIEEIGSEDELWLREGRAIAARMDRDGRFGWPRRMLDYGEEFDDSESMDGTEYDLYDDADTTVAYAVQLAMKDKEEWLVEKALERIRRAQMLGQKNVRLSGPELEALEHKRAQRSYRTTPESLTHRNAANGSMPMTPRGSNHTSPRKTPYSKGEGARASGMQTPPRSGSLRTAFPASSPRSPLQTPYSSPLTRSPVSTKSPTLGRPLPDDPHWVPPPYQISPSSYLMYSPMDPLRGSPGHPGMAPYMTGYPSAAAYGERCPPSRRHSVRSRHTPPASASEDDERSESDGSGDEVQMVDVVERKVPLGSPTHQTAHRGSRQRRKANRPR